MRIEFRVQEFTEQTKYDIRASFHQTGKCQLSEVKRIMKRVIVTLSSYQKIFLSYVTMSEGWITP